MKFTPNAHKKPALHLVKPLSKQITVVKIGGSILEENLDSLVEQVAVLVSQGIKLVIVHGGGPHISSQLKSQGIEPKFIDGLRVTDDATLDVVLNTLDQVNGTIVHALKQVGINAVGFSSDCPLFLSQKAASINGVDLGWVGKIQSVDLAQLDETNCDVAIVAPIGYGESSTFEGTNELDNNILNFTCGEPLSVYEETSFCGVTTLYNLNADHAAMGIATALKAESLVFLSDVPGVLEDCNDASSCIAQIKTSQVEQLINAGVIKGGMIQKIRNSAAALHAGVGRVCIADGRIEGAVIDTTLKRLRSGTTIGD